MSSDRDAQAPVAPGTDVMGDRVGAAAIDIIVLFVLGALVGLVFGGTHAGTTTVSLGSTHAHSASAGFSLTGWRAGLWAVLCLVYYFVLELRFGQTLGKRATSIRVVDADGDKPTAKAILLRTLGRIVDVLPVFYLLGFVVIVSGRSRQRIGDRIAHTKVVHT